MAYKESMVSERQGRLLDFRKVQNKINTMILCPNDADLTNFKDNQSNPSPSIRDNTSGHGFYDSDVEMDREGMKTDGFGPILIKESLVRNLSTGKLMKGRIHPTPISVRGSSFEPEPMDIVRRKSSGKKIEPRKKIVGAELVAWKGGSLLEDSNKCETINEESMARGDSGQISQRLTPQVPLNLHGLSVKIPKETTSAVNFTELSEPFKSARQTGQKKSLKSPSRSQMLSRLPLTDKYNLDSSKYLNQYMPKANLQELNKSGSTRMLNKKVTIEAMRVKKGLVGAGNLNLAKT
jgi:hypothetical protein